MIASLHSHRELDLAAFAACAGSRALARKRDPFKILLGILFGELLPNPPAAIMIPADSSEEISLEALRDNRSDAWGTAYKQLWKVGWVTARRKLPYDSREELEDLVSQTIAKEVVPQIISPRLESFVKATTFDDILNLTSRVVSSRAIDEIRRRTRSPEKNNIEALPEGDFATQPEGSKREIAEEVQLALSNLDERYRVLLEDYYFKEMSTDEIAKSRGRPKGSVCTDLVKARQMMGIFLEQRLESPSNQ